jgi:hypothetical protein
MEPKLKAQSWCLANGFKIYILPLKNDNRVKIVVENHDSKYISPVFYNNQSLASSKIWEIYEYLYKKHKKNKKN